MPKLQYFFFFYRTSKSIWRIEKNYLNILEFRFTFNIQNSINRLPSRFKYYTLLTQFPYYRHGWKKRLIRMEANREPETSISRVKFYFKHDACNARRIFHSHNVVKKRNASDECQGLASSNRYHATVKRRVHWR